MPIYEYECRKCGNIVELQHNHGTKPKDRCPECRGKMIKLFSPVGIVFKGSGFYCTDSKKSPSNENSKSGESGGNTSVKESVAA